MAVDQPSNWHRPWVPITYMDLTTEDGVQVCRGAPELVEVSSFLAKRDKHGHVHADGCLQTLFMAGVSRAECVDGVRTRVCVFSFHMNTARIVCGSCLKRVLVSVGGDLKGEVTQHSDNLILESTDILSF